ncbi:MAG: NUDIX domain-containing protein [Sphaerochaetaceae bacterium]|nr:NUDIX domain-containing protein [Sphaerochaetaceae bacterium]
MRLLFDLDVKDYDPNGVPLYRPSARAIIIKDKETIALIYSKKYDYYKFPGGGIEKDETHEETLIREVAEEAGLVIEKSSIKDFGYVHRANKSTLGDCDYFVQENYYYLCSITDKKIEQDLSGYEAEEGFTLCWVKPQIAINTNRTKDHGPKKQTMLERESRVLEILINEGFFN